MRSSTMVEALEAASCRPGARLCEDAPVSAAPEQQGVEL
jgi:hypothetical protein